MNIFAITLGFAPRRMIAEGMKNYYATASVKPVQHILLDQHYPLQREGEPALAEIAEQYGLKLVDSGFDRGLHKGFNYAFENHFDGMTDADCIVGFDPDSVVATPGWDAALRDALMADATLALCTLMNPISRGELQARGYTPKAAGALRYWVTHQACMGNVSAARVSYLRRAGGLHEPTNYYGHLESAMFAKIREQGLSWAYLQDFHEADRRGQATQHDPEYIAYKHAHAHSQHFKGSFAEFLAAGCPPP